MKHSAVAITTAFSTTFEMTFIMTAQDLLADIHALEEEILNFERKCGIRSEIFFAAYVAGEEPEDEDWVLDFGEWASIYRTWLARPADYRNAVDDETAADAARKRFRNYAGALSLGEATGVDNDEIDRDLAKAYSGLDQ